LGLRIPVKLVKGDRRVQVNALLNTGFEASKPLVSIPIGVAEALKLRPTRPLTFEGPGLTMGAAYHAGEVVVEVSQQGSTRRVSAEAIITVGEDEVALSDKCIEQLGIVIDLKGRRWWLT